MINSVTFNVTNSCNLNCAYCFEHSKNSMHLSLEDMKRSLDYLYPRHDKSSVFYVSFFGGEPLLRWNDIKSLIEYANSKEYLIEWSATTNFVYQFTDDDLKLVDDNNVYFLVSIDGDQETHDLNRCGSYKYVISNINKFKEHDLISRLEARITYTPETVDKLAHNVEHMFNLGFIDIGFYPVSDVKWEQSKLIELMSQTNKIKDWLIEKYNDVNNTQNIDIRNFNESISIFPEAFDPEFNFNDNIKTFKCSLQSVHQVTINPDLTVHACHQESTTDSDIFLLGTLDDLLNDKIPLNDISSKLDLSFLESDRILADGFDCKSCPAKKSCSGCCPSESFRQSKTFNQMPAVCCVSNLAIAMCKMPLLNALIDAKNVRSRVASSAQSSLKLYQNYLGLISSPANNPSTLVEAAKLLDSIKNNGRIMLEDYLRVIYKGLSKLLGVDNANSSK